RRRRGADHAPRLGRRRPDGLVQDERGAGPGDGRGVLRVQAGRARDDHEVVEPGLVQHRGQVVEQAGAGPVARRLDAAAGVACHDRRHRHPRGPCQTGVDLPARTPVADDPDAKCHGPHGAPPWAATRDASTPGRIARAGAVVNGRNTTLAHWRAQSVSHFFSICPPNHGTRKRGPVSSTATSTPSRHRKTLQLVLVVVAALVLAGNFVLKSLGDDVAPAEGAEGTALAALETLTVQEAADDAGYDRESGFGTAWQDVDKN